MSNSGEAKPSNLIFISDGKSSVLKELVDKTKGKPILVITEREGLTNKGACISFITLETGTLRFQVNKEELSSRNLQLSNSLIGLAERN